MEVSVSMCVCNYQSLCNLSICVRGGEYLCVCVYNCLLLVFECESKCVCIYMFIYAMVCCIYYVCVYVCVMYVCLCVSLCNMCVCGVIVSYTNRRQLHIQMHTRNCVLSVCVV